MYETKEIIANGFLTLINGKNPDKITVKDICKQSNVSRETFYYHFTDKYDLFKWIYKQNLKKRILNNSHESSWTDLIRKTISDALSNRGLFKKTMKNASSPEYSKIIFDALYEFYVEELSKGQPDSKLPEQVEAEIYIYLKGGIDYFKYYFEHHDDTSYDNISKLIAGAMPESLSQLWKNNISKT